MYVFMYICGYVRQSVSQYCLCSASWDRLIELNAHSKSVFQIFFSVWD